LGRLRGEPQGVYGNIMLSCIVDAILQGPLLW
jgi:hypothetical protein